MSIATKDLPSTVTRAAKSIGTRNDDRKHRPCSDIRRVARVTSKSDIQPTTLTATAPHGPSSTVMVTTDLEGFTNYDWLDALIGRETIQDDRPTRQGRGSEALAALGYADANNLAAAAYLLMAYQYGDLRISCRVAGTPVSAIVRTVQENPGLVRSVSVGSRCQSICSRSIAAFCHHLFSSQDRDKADRFFGRLIDGVNLSRTDPVLHLRNRLISERSGWRAQPTRLEVIALFFLAWSYVKAGLPISSLRWEAGDDVEFPTID